MEIFNKINKILRYEPDGIYNAYSLNESNNFIKIKKIILDNTNEESSQQQLVNSTLRWLNSYKNTAEELTFFIYNTKLKGEYSIAYKGLNIKNKLTSAYCDIQVEETKFRDEEIANLKFYKLITTIPLIKNDENIEFCYDQFIRLLKDIDVVFKISAKPVSQKFIDDIYVSLLEERCLISTEKEQDSTKSTCVNQGTSYQDGTSENKTDGQNLIVISQQEARSTNSSTTTTEGFTETNSESTKYQNYKVDAYDRILEQHIARVEDMKLNGGWQVVIGIYADSEKTLRLTQEAINSTFSMSLLEPIKFHSNIEGLSVISSMKKISNTKDKHILYRDLENHHNLYTTKELSFLFQPNLSNIKGFSIVKKPRFLQNIETEGDIYLGNLLDYSKDTGNKLKLSTSIINKHILVAGMTGSGKTNTVLSILNNTNVPFLIIEPAKSEYRILKSIIPNIQIYTLGRENVSPFRFNPFKFNYKKISVQEHIDNLKVIFTAAFTMYASMPNILEQCLVNIYTKKGWSLITSTNMLCKSSIVEEYFYPTLEDLYCEINIYIDSLGYAVEQNQNIRAALLTRIKSLMTGAKGFMFNTINSVDFNNLLQSPTIIELEGIVDDVEKSLIIGLLMLNVYESVKSNNNSYSNSLKHIIVIEEAHRLFGNFSMSENEEQINMRSKAVENLSNMLCEIRAYGEGLIIVDQVPTKLAPDVLKNTNTKIIHRLVSKEDCEYIAKSIQINNKNIDFIPTLKVGEALVYTEELEETAHIKVNFNKDNYSYYSDEKVKENALEYNLALREEIMSNPIVESLISYNEVKEKLTKEISNYVDEIYNGKASLKDSYNKIKKICIRETYNNGFEIKQNVDSYVIELIKRIIIVMVNKKKWSNNIEQKYRFLSMVDSALKIGVNSEYVKEKEIKAFKIAIKQDIIQNL